MSARSQCLPGDLLYSVKLEALKWEGGSLLRVAGGEYLGQINISRCLWYDSRALKTGQT